MVTSELIEKTSGKAKVSLRVDLVDGQFKDVSFGVMYYDSIPQEGYIYLTQYGLAHTNEGEYKETISKALKKVEDKIVADYGVTFDEIPEQVDVEPIREQT